ncbi:MAG: hypothetical protein HWD89_12090 [Tenacibaculum sp.]|uniref:hypothetical protein n=1 Tax=Tenacibaculum TaxID=104267 RepID=UPI000F59C881|nr:MULTISPECIES: hypothetical protein [Tenacibaculum]NVK09784.1 hypothetical protein [Tenacibaculum sp.]
MKKKLLYTALLAVCMISCSKNENLPSEDKPLTSSKVKVVNYIYKGENYSITIDVSDEENSILLEGKDNKILSEIYKNQEELTTVYIDDSKFYLFDNIEDYEKSTLYAENEKKAAAFKKSSKINQYSAKSNYSTIPDVLPDKGENTSIQAYFYRRSQFRFYDGGFYITLPPGYPTTYEIPDFRYINNSSSYYGATGVSVIPGPVYDSTKAANETFNHNDAISSIYVNFMHVTVYEHQNYKGRSLVFDGRVLRSLSRDLNDRLYNCGLFGCDDWNDKMSSAKIKL